jgi:y4mF family transcriptional regulator
VQRVTSVESLGKAVRKARKSLKLTQEQLAFAAGVGSRFIVDLEAGKSTLTLEPALRVVDALGGVVQLIDMPDEDEPKHAS